jgi:hypothetical protein
VRRDVRVDRAVVEARSVVGVWYGHDRLMDADSYFIKLEK